jgi:GDPmannose 4,6-dehydratase
MFGKTDTSPQTESTPFRPQSPYAAAKVLAYVLCRYYRDVFGMFVSTGIFYNHESPRRTEEYVTGKIVHAAARIKLGLQDKLYLGDLSTRVDFGYAPDYVEAAWNILQLEKPDDFVVCTGEAHSIQEFLEESFRYLGLDPEKYVEFDKKFIRPGKTSDLVGDFSKATKAFGYQPKVKFQELVKILVDAAMETVKKEKYLKDMPNS